ncbi:septum site-determining protein Ssd [Glycomyces buryatensis]|uniref:Septum formation initiator n=1 Tax=Glycomyces buryatensis TaxID=2570927 RepID=A0A4S8QBD1_9ACTN|nr:septum site-determining protein Ssd [Glycomyces buryatensis]THV41580.1 hypothetical protein FAB82_10780 [Glycomyces buryatensis]
MAATSTLKPAATTRQPQGAAVGLASESLLITGDDRLAELVAPLAAATGHPLHRVRHPRDAEPRWQRAPLVIVGADVAPDCLAHRLPERPGLILCTTMAWLGADPADTSMLWPMAIQLHADHVIAVPEGAEWLLDRFTRAKRAVTLAPVVATVAGHGGAGASTLALGLATAAAQSGKRAVLIDLDVTGGGIDAAAGLASQSGWRWPSLAGATGPFEPERLLAGLPQRGELYLIGPDPHNPAGVDPELVGRVLHAARLAADLIVTDLPREPSEAAIRAASAARSVALLVAPGERNWEAARSVRTAYGLHASRLGLVRRTATGAGHARPAGASRKNATPARARAAQRTEPEDATVLPVWGQMPTDRNLPTRLRQGRLPRGRTARVVDALGTELVQSRTACGERSRRAADRAGSVR